MRPVATIDYGGQQVVVLQVPPWSLTKATKEALQAWICWLPSDGRKSVMATLRCPFLPFCAGLEPFAARPNQKKQKPRVKKTT